MAPARCCLCARVCVLRHSVLWRVAWTWRCESLLSRSWPGSRSGRRVTRSRDSLHTPVRSSRHSLLPPPHPAPNPPPGPPTHSCPFISSLPTTTVAATVTATATVTAHDARHLHHDRHAARTSPKGRDPHAPGPHLDRRLLRLHPSRYGHPYPHPSPHFN